MGSGHGERRDADRNARRSQRFENGSVNRIHRFELGYIGEEDLRRNQQGKRYRKIAGNHCVLRACRRHRHGSRRIGQGTFARNLEDFVTASEESRFVKVRISALQH
jgi:hypothetical protein